MQPLRLLLVLLLLLPVMAFAESEAASERPKIGLVLIPTLIYD